MDGATIVKVIMAIFLPPLAVFLERGCGTDLFINIVLCILVWFPGMLHALYIVFSSN